MSLNTLYFSIKIYTLKCKKRKTLSLSYRSVVFFFYFCNTLNISIISIWTLLIDF